jgi:hypothetical protein
MKNVLSRIIDIVSLSIVPCLGQLISSLTGGGSSVPGGSDTQVQFNDGGSFNGDSTFTFNKSTKAVAATSFSGALTGNITGNVTGNCSGSSASCTGNAATASNLTGTPAIPNGTTATTQSAGDNSTKLATTAYVDAAAPLTGTCTSSTTIYPGSDGSNTGTKVHHFTVTALAANATFNTPKGTWVDGERLTIRIIDAGTAKTLDFTTSTAYTAINVVLPTTTVISKYLYLVCLYNSTTSKFDVVYVGQQ